MQCIGEVWKHCYCVGLWINTSPSVFAAQVRPSPGCAHNLLGQMNIHVCVSCTSQPPSCHPRTLVKYAPTPPASGVWTEATICMRQHICANPRNRAGGEINWVFFYVGCGRWQYLHSLQYPKCHSSVLIGLHCRKQIVIWSNCSYSDSDRSKCSEETGVLK